MGAGSTSVELRGPHEAGGRALGGGHAPHPREHLPWLLHLNTEIGKKITFLPKITSPIDFVPFRLRLIFLFFETLK